MFESMFAGEAPLYRDRAEAGRELAGRLRSYGGRPDTVVLGIPRGGVAVAAEIARSLRAPLDVIVARKLGAPGAGEFAIGAVTADGRRFLNDDTIAYLGVSQSYLDEVTEVQMEEAHQRELRYRNLRPAVPLAGRVVIVVDDGLATGATMRAALRSVRANGPSRIIVAVPVGSAEACLAVRHDTDELVCPHALTAFGAVGLYYERFEPVEDTQVERMLEEARRRTEPLVLAAGPTGAH
jgi:predicted phosphoribosyltransferase